MATNILKLEDVLQINNKTLDENTKESPDKENTEKSKKKGNKRKRKRNKLTEVQVEIPKGARVSGRVWKSEKKR